MGAAHVLVCEMRAHATSCQVRRVAGVPVYKNTTAFAPVRAAGAPTKPAPPSASGRRLGSCHSRNALCTAAGPSGAPGRSAKPCLSHTWRSELSGHCNEHAAILYIVGGRMPSGPGASGHVPSHRGTPLHPGASGSTACPNNIGPHDGIILNI